jgi:CrcB protein
VQFVAVAVGAMLGANLRFLIGTWAIERERWGTDFPYGTFIVNVSGAFAIGLVPAFLGERFDVSPLWRLFFATGFLGGYTTFSAYAWEALTMAEQGAFLRAGVYVLGSNVIGFAGVWLGATLARLTPS